MQQVTVKSEDKVDLFRERGLSAAEMKLLATFSSEERFREGSMIFREGEKGDKLYIVLDGRVRISKFIPGVGEEALTVLDRGDFFGEMALIDDKPRSADAQSARRRRHRALHRPRHAQRDPLDGSRTRRCSSSTCSAA